jgi:uncharacterized delta-60 repeat protein
MKSTTTIFVFLISIVFSSSVSAQAGLDQTFAGTGKLTRSLSSGYDFATATAVQDDGKILLAGYATTNGTANFILIRYLANGNMDVNFGDSGTVITDFGKTEIPFAMLIQPDGKIILAGEAHPVSNADFALVRYKTNGQLDSSFGKDGLATAAVGTLDDFAQAVTLQKDGKIVVAGYSLSIPNYDFSVARFHSDGRLDSSFSTDGVAIVSLGTNADYANAVKVQANGKIVVSGRFVRGGAYDIGVIRLNANGTPDFDFGNMGVVMTNIGSADDMGYALAIQPDQKILVGGTANTGSYNDFAVVRYDTMGVPDPTFGGDGKQTIAIGTENDFAYSMILQPDNKIVIGGCTKIGMYNNFALARLNTDGNTDSTFGSNGKATFPIGSNNDIILSMALQTDGKIVAAGVSNNGTDYDFALARYIPGNSSEIQTIMSQGTISAQVYPNPVKSEAILEYYLDEHQVTSIQLVDMQGRYIHTFLEAEQAQGVQNIVLTFPENLDNGLYIIKISTKNHRGILKIFKQ